jgi:type VI secretion system Hcp family effector
MKNSNYVRGRYSLLIAIIIGLVSGPVNAAIFMFIPGIPGESHDANHDMWIDVLATGGSFTQNSCGEFVVTKETDKAFPLLVASVVSGSTFSESIQVEYTANFGGSRATYSTITLDGASISSISTSASGFDEAPPVENITIEASSITIEYIEYDGEGNKGDTIIETLVCGKSKDK